MVVALSSTVTASPFQVKDYIAPLRVRTCIFTGLANCRASYKTSRGRTIAQFMIPDEVKMQMKAVKEQLWKSLPDPVRDCSWKEAESRLVQRLLSLGQEAIKWSFIVWFLLSFLSDVLLAISTNRELLIPFGLFAGCFLSDYMRETSDELFQQSEVKDVNWKFLGITCVFVLVKLLSVLFTIQGLVFLLLVANGGLMQILWLWKKSRDEENAQAECDTTQG